MRSGRFVCHSVCVQDYCKSNQPISLKLGVMTWPTNQKNWLTFRGGLVPDTDSRSLFHFPHQSPPCRHASPLRHGGILGDLLALYSHRLIFTILSEMSDTDKVMSLQRFGSDPAHVQIRIRGGLIQQSVFSFG